MSNVTSNEGSHALFISPEPEAAASTCLQTTCYLRFSPTLDQNICFPL